jgi:hypothetical protein
MLEYWSIGFRIFHYSNIPSLHYSNLFVPPCHGNSSLLTQLKS